MDQNKPVTHRRLLNAQELAIDNQVKKEVFSMQDRINFACGGTLPKSSIDFTKLQLYYLKVERGITRGSPALATFPLTQDSAHQIYEAGEPSPFGRGKDLVYDEEYRQAHELKPPHFALTTDPLLHSALPTLLGKKLDYTSPLSIRLNKLNAYTKGGFFKTHKDTPQGKDHIGTLMLCLPSPFQGGNLVVRQGDVAVTFDWSHQVKNGSIAWGFLYSDCEHEVLPVQEGTRITLQYDVFISQKPTWMENEETLDSRMEPIRQAFAKFMDPSFVPEGGKLAFGLLHGYPSEAGDTDLGDGLTKRLKGVDALLISFLDSSNFKWSYFALHDVDNTCWDNESIDEDNDTDEEEKAQEIKKIKAQESKKGKIDKTFKSDKWIQSYVISDDGGQVESSDPAELGLKRDLDLIWISIPDDFSMKGHFISYGNSPQMETIYAAVGIQVHLPPASERPKGKRPSPKIQQKEGSAKKVKDAKAE
ncbi:uncharacterized protein IL334_001902 [Kwoniella shivajii]|uniref:Fe2OG dioxygenase domain-containing protein n=1 Tax=Kwoniella shivajii TaxID=564305 RepID=A0ABZ1CT83_9TREE|nr:hypothetical protein IL334_001902 [Kwoniella shivajii]